MEKLLIDSSVVIVSRGFNVPLFSQLWLKNKGIFSEEELIASAPFFTPVASQIDTKNCTLLIQTERIQLAIKRVSDSDAILEKLRRIIIALPECPYSGIGFNFTWNIIPVSKSVSEIAQDNFLPKSDSNPWNEEFGKGENVKIGAFYSKQFDDSLMNVDIRPKVINVASGEATVNKESISFCFNFHHELNAENAVELMQKYLNSWRKKYEEANRIVDLTIE